MALGTAPSRRDHGFIALEEEQREAALALANSRRARLDGPPGAGKTHVAGALAATFANAGLRVLYLCPRAPLAGWVKWNLGVLGVTVKTIGGHMRDVIDRAGAPSITRRSYDDADFFCAAREAARPGEYDLVIGDEWQATSSDEQGFVRKVVGEERFIEVLDSSRDVRLLPPREIDAPVDVQLTRTYRHSLCRAGPDGVRRALASVAEGAGGDPGITALADSGELKSGLQSAIDAFLAAGFAPSEIGVVSCQARAESRGIEVMKQVVTPPGALLGTPARNHGIAADSFSYWLGLERRAIVVIEAPLELVSRAAKLHTATSRACEALRVVLTTDEMR